MSELQEKTTQCCSTRGKTNPLIQKGSVMAIVRISEPVRKDCKDGKRSRKRLFARYRCDCGVEFEMSLRNDGRTKSCGCARAKNGRAQLTGNKHGLTHGKNGTSEHKTWIKMKQRCDNPNDKSYFNYGGRGISVCERWQSFENFYADMGPRPDGHSLDRIDSDGNYCPENCRWADARTQARNRRSNVLIAIDGVEKSVVEWSEQAGSANAKRIHARLASGWSSREAVFGK